MGFNLFTFFCLREDKKRARKEMWRIPGAYAAFVLHYYSGSVGALAGMYLCRRIRQGSGISGSVKKAGDAGRADHAGGDNMVKRGVGVIRFSFFLLEILWTF